MGKFPIILYGMQHYCMFLITSVCEDNADPPQIIFLNKFSLIILLDKNKIDTIFSTKENDCNLLSTSERSQLTGNYFYAFISQ